MKVLVVGGTRFLGHELAWRLLAAGHEVTLFNRGTLPDTFGARVERLRGDRTTADFERLLAGRSFDAAVDFAAYDGPDGRRAAEVLGGRVGHYVVISTGQVYLVREGCPRPARESDYDGPLMPEPADAFDKGQWDYGVRKRALEDALAEAWSTSRFPSTRLRIPMVSGERDHFRRLERYLWRMLDGGPVLLPDGGDRVTRHVYSGSVVRAILALLGRPETFGQAYNLAQDETPTLRELLDAASRSGSGRPARLVDVPAERVRAAGLDPLLAVALQRDAGCRSSTPSRAKAELGFRPRAARLVPRQDRDELPGPPARRAAPGLRVAGRDSSDRRIARAGPGRRPPSSAAGCERPALTRRPGGAGSRAMTDTLAALARPALLVALAAVAASAVAAPAAKPGPVTVYVGTYTDGTSRGIYRFTFDPATGATTEPVLAAETKNPTFLALHPNGRFLYAVGEVSSFEGAKTGAVSAFAIDPKTGRPDAPQPAAVRRARGRATSSWTRRAATSSSRTTAAATWPSCRSGPTGA